MMNSQEPLVLQSLDGFDKVFLFNPERLSYEIASKEGLGMDGGAVSGMASLKEGGFCALYKYQNGLWAAFDCRSYAVTKALTSTWSMEDWKPAGKGKRSFFAFLKDAEPVSSARRFELIHNGTVVEQRSYTIVESDPDTRPFVIWDDEDEDFLLWMHNMLHGLERQELVRRGWK